MSHHALRKTRRKEKRHSRREMGISWRLFGVLLVFIAFSLIVIWVFQILLLNRFYERSKMSEFNTTDTALTDAISDMDRLNATAAFYATEYDECIRVFCIDGGEATELVEDMCTTPSCFIHHVSADVLSEYCNKAMSSDDGIYIAQLSKPKRLTEDGQTRALGTVYVSVKHVDNQTYVIMLNSEHIPLKATINTLEMQFGWIAFVLIIAAFIIAVVISRTVCKPLREMGESAEKLARGDYNAKFRGGGYRESQELADALNYAAEELSKTDNLQKELVANISHDLRTPLTMIKGYGEVMRDIPEENTPENIQVIIDETERLTELVNDMLDLSKIRSGARKPSLTVFNLTQTVQDVMSRYVKLTERDGYSISFDFDREIFVCADRTMILQVVYNLINNAINYTGPDKFVKVTQIQTEGHVRIQVTDTGKGIAKEDMPLVWDRYYKVDKVHRRATVGTGLGLSIVKGVLEAHNASYGLTSMLGEGSTFWFELEIEKSEYIKLDEQGVHMVGSDKE